MAILVTGLFPPWVYTYFRTGTSDASGGRSENSAGYFFIFTPPPPENYYPTYGVKLDMERLLVEWACILVVSGAAWTIFGTQKPPLAHAPTTGEKATHIPFDKSDFKSDPQIYSALENFKGRIEEEKSQKPEEKPRMHHYNFAYKALPGLAFADVDVPLGFGHDTPKGSLSEFWKHVGAKCPENERLSDSGLSAIDTHFGPDYVILLVTMPTPLRIAEAHFAAIIYPKSWFKSPDYENKAPELSYYILAKNDFGGTFRVLTKTGHGAVKWRVPISAEAFLNEIQIALQKPPRFITWVDSKPWNFFMQDTETGETFGAD